MILHFPEGGGPGPSLHQFEALAIVAGLLALHGTMFYLVLSRLYPQ